MHVFLLLQAFFTLARTGHEEEEAGYMLLMEDAGERASRYMYADSRSVYCSGTLYGLLARDRIIDSK